MKVIESKKVKPMKVKCQRCQRKLEVEPKDCHYAWPSAYQVTVQCPVCRCVMPRIDVKRKFWEGVCQNIKTKDEE